MAYFRKSFGRGKPLPYGRRFICYAFGWHIFGKVSGGASPSPTINVAVDF
jgi:hypothetical protein